MRPGLYGTLLASVAASVAVQGAVPPSDVQAILVSALLGLNLVLAVRVARAKPLLAQAALALAVAGVVVNILLAVTDAIGEGEVRLMNALVVLLGPPAVAIGVLRSLRINRVVRIDAVLGVLSLYMMLGMLFAFVYGSLDHLGGDPFFAGGEEATVARCLYFSFTTLTTVGYGDLTARSDLGHTLCIFEALIGQIYLVTVVSLIVGNLSRRDPKRVPQD
jgi:Ion channel